MCRCMASKNDQDIRQLFTEIGCIMEDASVVALVWSAESDMDVTRRLHALQDAHRQTGELLARIEQSLSLL